MNKIVILYDLTLESQCVTYGDFILNLCIEDRENWVLCINGDKEFILETILQKVGTTDSIIGIVSLNAKFNSLVKELKERFQVSECHLYDYTKYQEVSLTQLVTDIYKQYADYISYFKVTDTNTIVESKVYSFEIEKLHTSNLEHNILEVLNADIIPTGIYYTTKKAAYAGLVNQVEYKLQELTTQMKNLNNIKQETLLQLMDLEQKRK